jgi:DNA-binding CsgD family transcriptional regulator
MPPSTPATKTGSPKPPPNSLPLSALHPLSLREGEVLGWIVEGKRDAEIAAILGLSRRTVEKHVQHILAKLGVETRTGAGTWWHERRRTIERATMQKAQ